MFVLWNPNSQINITTVYHSLQQAEKVAEIMCRRNPGETFAVLKLVQSYIYKGAKKAAVKPTNH